VANRHALRLRFEPLESRLALSTLAVAGGVEFRSIDGTGNNLAKPSQGAAETREIRFRYGAEFPDGFGDAIITAPQRANPRSISNALMTQCGNVPNNRHLTDWVFQWGQFITHDMDLTENGPQWNILSTGEVGDFSIPVLDPNDPLGPNPIPFDRSRFDPATGTPDPVPGSNQLNHREVINSVTSYLDASQIYGSDAERAAALRTFHGGKLKTSARGLLPPANDAGLPNEDPLGLGSQLFLAGDIRANEQVNLTAVHTLFIREHNRLAERIHDFYPAWNDERIYQTARRIVGAEIQAITYGEYLPAVLGFDNAPRAEDAKYDPAVDATITNSFAHAFFRFGHSEVNESTLLVNNAGRTVDTLSIDDAFFNPDFLQQNPRYVDYALLGLASQLGQEVDLKVVDGLRNTLFGPPGSGGRDLAALDLQRGRDHGLPDYNTLRAAYGLPKVTTFAQISSDPQIRAKLKALYGSVDNIDPFVGALAEDHLPGASVGPTILASVGNQFQRLRDGDRFFYTTDTLLQSAAVRRIVDIHQVTLSQIIRWNTNITRIQDNVFFDSSVLVFRAAASGSNVSLIAQGNLLSLVDNAASRLLAVMPLDKVSLVILAGSRTAPDMFTLSIATAAPRLKGGVAIYGVNSTVDTLNVLGTARQDWFTVASQETTVNGVHIRYAGFKTIRLFTLLGADTVQIAPGMPSKVLVV
jgi:peroxidase